MEPPPAEVERSEQAEQFLVRAQLHRMREQWAEAEACCREALAVHPQDAGARELLADLQVQRGDLDAALAAYRELFAEHPERGALEEKIAQVILAQDELERERLSMELALNTPVNREAQKRNVTIAIFVSLLCPGAGQFLTGQMLKGAVLLVTGLLGLALGGEHLLRMFFGLAGISSPVPANSLLAALGVMGVFSYLYGILDASSHAGRLDRAGGGRAG